MLITNPTFSFQGCGNPLAFDSQIVQRHDGFSYAYNSKSSSVSSHQSTQSTQYDNPQGQIWFHSSDLKKVIVWENVSQSIQMLANSFWLASMKSFQYFKYRLKQIIETKQGVHSVYGKTTFPVGAKGPNEEPFEENL